MKSLRTRLATVAAAGALLVAPVALAAPAGAIETGDGTNPVIEVEGGVAIAPLSADLGADDVELDPSVVGEDGELDRSHLARTPEVDEDGDGFEDIVPLEAGTPIVDEDGDGYEDITPLGGAEIEPISAELEDEGGSNAGWIVGGVAAAAVVAGGLVLVRRRAAA